MNKFSLRILYLIIIYFSCVNYCFSHSKYLRFKNINDKNGLSNNWINSIAEDDRGFIWAATKVGLNVYNGFENKVLVYGDDSLSLSTNDISEIIYSKHKKIIVGTWGGGLNIVDPYTKKVQRIAPFKGAEKMVIKTMIEDSDSIIWIGTYGNGLFKFNYLKNELTKCDFKATKEENQETFDYCQDLIYDNGKVWLTSTFGGIGYVSEGTDEIHSLKDQNGKPLNIVNIACLSFAYGKLIIGKQDADVYFYDFRSKEITSTLSLKSQNGTRNRLNSIVLDKDNDLWISTTFGLFYYSHIYKKTQKVYSSINGRAYNNNFCSFVDSQGVIWIGTWGEGLFYYSEEKTQFKEIEFTKFNSPIVNSVFLHQDSLLLIGSNNGVIKHNIITNKKERMVFKGPLAHYLSENTILSIDKYQDKVIFALDGLGLFLVDKNMFVTRVQTSENPKFVNTVTTDIFRLSNGNVWVGSWSKGAFLLNEKSGEYQEFFYDKLDPKSIGSNTVFCAVEDQEGKTWIGTQKGLQLYNPKDKKFSPPPFVCKINGVPYTDIQGVKSMAVDNQGFLWVACLDGLLKINLKSGEAMLLNHKNGLIDDIIYNIILIDDHIWGTTHLGLIRISTIDNSIKNFTTKNGLISNTFNDRGGFYSKEGELYLTNGSKVVHFQPKEIIQGKNEIKIFLNHILINDKKVYFKENSSYNEVIELDYNQNNLTIDVLLLNYFANKNSKFAQRLIGFDTTWLQHDYNDHLLRFTNLEAGEYTLELAVINDEGEISPVLKKVGIVIKKPFWQELGFIIILILCISVAIYYFFRLKMKSIRKHNNNLEVKVEEKTEELSFKSEELEKERKISNSNLQYASLLQKSFLPSKTQINTGFKDNFIFFKPKGVVSGDFYWFKKVGNKSIFVVADSTGEEVSGAFISVIASRALGSIVEAGTLRPDLILNELHDKIVDSIGQRNFVMKDGMDISVICFDSEHNLVESAAAVSNIIFVDSDGNPKRIKGDPYPIGGDLTLYEQRDVYTLHTYKVDTEHTIYMYTDGFVDQFEGEGDNKFIHSDFRNLLRENYQLRLSSQKNVLNEKLGQWKDANREIDDILVVALKVVPGWRYFGGVKSE